MANEPKIESVDEALHICEALTKAAMFTLSNLNAMAAGTLGGFPTHSRADLEAIVKECAETIAAVKAIEGAVRRSREARALAKPATGCSEARAVLVEIGTATARDDAFA
jgi:hypothetical protein